MAGHYDFKNNLSASFYTHMGTLRVCVGVHVF